MLSSQRIASDDQYDMTGVRPARTALLSEERYPEFEALNWIVVLPGCCSVTSRPPSESPDAWKKVCTLKGCVVSTFEPPSPYSALVKLRSPPPSPAPEPPPSLAVCAVVWKACRLASMMSISTHRTLHTLLASQ